MINRDRLVNTFMDIVKIDSVSGEEDEIAEDLARRLDALGLCVEVDGYGNLIANPPDFDPGKGQPPMLLSVHMDTVDPGRGIQPRVVTNCRSGADRCLVCVVGAPLARSCEFYT